MPATEILVVLIGLYIGYWVVSRLLAARSKDEVRSETQPGPDGRAPNGNAYASPPWHEILNVSPHATLDEIRQAYKTLMQQYHPDKVAALGDELKALAERKSKEINGAYIEATQRRGGG